MGTSIIAAAMTLLTADNTEFVLKKEDLTCHSRMFKDLAEDFGGNLPNTYESDMSRDEAALFCAAVEKNPHDAELFCDTLSPSKITQFMPVADYYDLTAYMPLLPKAFAHKIRAHAEHAKIMAGVFPRRPRYPILRLLLARAVVGMPAFLSQSMRSSAASRPLALSQSLSLYRPIRCVRFSHDGAKIFAVCSDSVIRVYDVARHKISQELTRNYAEQITDCIPIASSRILVTSSGHILRLWESDNAGIYADAGPLGWHRSDVVGLAAVPAAPHQVVSAATNGEVLLWDVECQKKIIEFDVSTMLSTPPTVSSDNQVALGSQFGEMVLFDMQSKSIVYDSIVYTFGVVPYFDSNGQLIVVTAEGSLKIFDRAKNSLRTGRNFAARLYNFAPTPDGSLYVVRTARPSLVVLKAKTFEQIRTTMSSNERPLAAWGEHPRALRVASNYNSNLIIHDITARQCFSSPLIARCAQQCTYEQMLLFAALDRDIEQGENGETFFHRAPALYPYYTELPDDIQAALKKAFNLKPPSIIQKVSLALADIPFLKGL